MSNPPRHHPRRLFVAFLLFATIIAVLALPMFQSFPVPPDDETFWRDARLSGAIAAGIDGDRVVARYWSAEQPDSLARQLLMPATYEDGFPRLRKFKTLSNSETEISVQGAIAILGPMKASFSFRARLDGGDTGPVRNVSWSGTATGLSSNCGTWTLRECEGGTAVTYRAHLDPRFAPQRLLNACLVRLLPRYLKPFQEFEL